MSEFKLVDPLKLIRVTWPSVVLYREQKDILYSVEENPETIVPAGNQLGKDWITALIVLVFYLRRQSARVLTTSVDQPQLEQVLWGEMAGFIAGAEYKLPLKINHLSIKKINNGVEDPKGYLIGRTAANQAGLQGHHLPRINGTIPSTLAVYDEASGITEEMFNATRAWRHTMLVIGNCFPCRNYFYQSAKEGNLVDPINPEKLYRRVIKIKAEHSPNVRYGLAEKKAGHEISFTEMIPGVVSIRDYLTRRATWNEMSQTIGLDAEFFEGDQVKLFTDAKILMSSQRWATNPDTQAESIGIDPAAGGDNTSFAVSSKTKLLKLESSKTPDTTVIVDKAIILMSEYGVRPENVGIDQGGGGLQIAHALRRKGYPVRTINFGGAFKMQKRAGIAPVKRRIEAEERMQAYRNKRAFMYHLLSLRMDPNSGYELFDISKKQLGYQTSFKQCTLRQQMEPVPFLLDNKGVIYMLSKARKTKVENTTQDREYTLTELIGHSPDELEAVLISLMVQYDKVKALGGGLGSR